MVTFLSDIKLCIIQKIKLSFAEILFSSFLISFPSFFSFQNVYSQESAGDILVSFVKPITEMADAGSYFNVLKIENKSSISIKGEVLFGYPESWVFIGNSHSSIEIAAGQTTIIPVRISVPRKTVGGISYLIGAEVRTQTVTSYASAYVSLQGKSKWDIKVLNKEVYLSAYRPFGELGFRISNSGNINELVKLKFNIGGLLEVINGLESDSILFLEVPAYSDTIILLKIRKKPGLNYAQNRALSQNWKSTSIYLEASSPDKTVYSGMRAFPLESSFINGLPRYNSPLNIDLTLNNLLSSQKPKISTKIYGKIFFPDAQQIQYSLGIYNMYVNPDRNRNIDLNQKLRYMLKYSDKRTQVWIGDRLGTGMLHTLSGSGFEGKFTFNEANTVYLNVIQNIFGKNYGAHVGYSSIIDKASVNTGLTLETTRDNQFSFYTFHLGGSYNILSKHSIRMETATSLSHYVLSPESLIDTTKLGFAYRLAYNYNYRKLKIRIDNMNTRYTYLRNSGINRIDADGSYLINPSTRLQALFNHNRYAATKYPINFYFPANMNSDDNGRLIFSFTKNGIIYQIGPQFFYTSREYNNALLKTHSRYINNREGINSSVTFRLGTLRSITPNFTLNRMSVKYVTDETTQGSYNSKGIYQYTAGISYYDQSIKLNAYYSSGEASDIYRSVIVDEKPVINQAMHLRAYYERYFMKETIKLSTFFNYSYYIPSLRENTIYNITSDFFLKSGWNIYTNFNMYKNARVDETYGRISLRDVNVVLGFRYTFDIQQPSLKYYDLTILGFNDMDGNGSKEENEKPVSNILIRISRDPLKNIDKKTGFTETSMITDVNGEIFYGKIPEGIYNLEITPLSNLEDRFFLNGESQLIEVHKDGIVYLPLVESYKIIGKVLIDRDPNSNEGNLSLEGIKITAESETGETFSVLTGSYGTYVLNLPYAKTYKVFIYNVLGERFMLERNEYTVQFSGNKTINLNFKFTEMKRGIRFNDGENLFQFNLKSE